MGLLTNAGLPSRCSCTRRCLVDSPHPDHFFALIPRQKNMKPSGFASCTAGALHIFWCLTSKARKHKMCFILLCAWHARGVQDTKCFIKAWRWSIVSFHFTIWSSFISFRYEALFRYTSQYEALRLRSVWWKNEKWELCLQIFLTNAALFSGKEKSHGKNFK